jgi:hypothetical protein
MSRSVHILATGALHVTVEHDWLVFGLGVGGLTLTLLAVIVALWGPAWRQMRRRPRLALAIERDWAASTIYLTVSNDASRDTAADVEVHVLEAHRPTTNWLPNASFGSQLQPRVGRPLQWSERRGQADTAIPAGFTRRCCFVRMPLPSDRPELRGDPKAHREAYAYQDADVPLHLTGVVLLEVLPDALDISDFWSEFTPTAAPARFIVAVAGANVQTTQYEVRVSFDPRWFGFYEHEIDVWFDIAIVRSGPQLTPDFSDHPSDTAAESPAALRRGMRRIRGSPHRG